MDQFDKMCHFERVDHSSASLCIVPVVSEVSVILGSLKLRISIESRSRGTRYHGMTETEELYRSRETNITEIQNDNCLHYLLSLSTISIFSYVLFFSFWAHLSSPDSQVTYHEEYPILHDWYFCYRNTSLHARAQYWEYWDQSQNLPHR